MSKIKNGGLDQYAKCKAFNGIGGERVKSARRRDLEDVVQGLPTFLTTRHFEEHGGAAGGYIVARKLTLQTVAL